MATEATITEAFSGLRLAGRDNLPCAAGVETELKVTTGGIGDYLGMLWVKPNAGTTSPGQISMKDGSGGSVRVLYPTGGLRATDAPFPIPIMANSVNGTWRVTMPANCTADAIGDFL